MNRKAGLYLTLAALVGGAASCGSAAGVFLDIPQPEPSSVPDQASAQALASDTVLPPPEIESVFWKDSVLARLPRDAAGNIDWVAAVEQGIIRPRSSVDGRARPTMDGFAYDLLLKGDNAMFDAYFPHSAHVQWSACESCHPAVFPYRGEKVTMAQINAGEACGKCHGSVAFSAATCERCHLAMTMPADRMSPQFIGDIRFKVDSSEVGRSTPPALFPHWSHRVRYRCSACHPAVFPEKAGESRPTMSEMSDGESCGACHNDEVSFGLIQCNRCHQSEPSEVNASEG